MAKRESGCSNRQDKRSMHLCTKVQRLVRHVCVGVGVGVCVCICACNDARNAIRAESQTNVTNANASRSSKLDQHDSMAIFSTAAAAAVAVDCNWPRQKLLLPKAGWLAATAASSSSSLSCFFAFDQIYA